MSEIASRAVIQEVRLDVLANNLANINTLGFKEDMLSFLPSDSNGDAGEVSGTVQSKGASALFPYETRPYFSPGQLKETGNSLDVALQGDGFFCVQTEIPTAWSNPKSQPSYSPKPKLTPVPIMRALL